MALTAKQRATAVERREQLVAIVRKFPEVDIDVYGVEHLAIKVRNKAFAYYSFDHHDDGKISLWAKATLSEQRREIADDPKSFYAPAYLGPRGWVALRLDLSCIDWKAVERMLRRAYLLSAPKKLCGLVE